MNCKKLLYLLAVLCAALTIILPSPILADDQTPPVVSRSSWGAIKALYRQEVGQSDSASAFGVQKPGAQLAGAYWGNNLISEAFYALCEQRSGSSHKFYYGQPMSDWEYPWRGDCCNALNRVTSLMYGSNTSWRGGLGTWNGFQQGGQCKFFANLVLYRSSYGYPGGHLFLPSGYSYAPYGWRQAQAGWIIQAPSSRPHTAIVVANHGSSLEIIDSNWIGGDGNFAIGRHWLSASTLDNWGFRAYNPWENPRLVQ